MRLEFSASTVEEGVVSIFSRDARTDFGPTPVLALRTLLQRYKVPVEYRFNLFQRLCLAFAFPSLSERRALVRIRIIALTVLGMLCCFGVVEISVSYACCSYVADGRRLCSVRVLAQSRYHSGNR